MTAPRTRNTPSTGSIPAAGTLVPAQASSPETTPPTDRLAYSVDEAAALTGLSRDLLYDEMRRGNLNYLKIGRRRIITRQHLEQFLAITPEPQPSSGSVVKAANRAP
jgi:excisionase family DNA binding protein